MAKHRTYFDRVSIRTSFFFSATPLSASSAAKYPPSDAAARAAKVSAGNQGFPVQRPVNRMSVQMPGQENLHSERNPDRNAGASLSAHRTIFKLAREAERHPVGDRELTGDRENERQDRCGQNRTGRQPDANRKQCHRQRDFENQNRRIHQIFGEQNVAETNRSRVVIPNAFAFVCEAIVGGRHQHQDEIAHHARKKDVGCDSRVSHGGMLARKLRTEQENEQRRHQ